MCRQAVSLNFPTISAYQPFFMLFVNLLACEICINSLFHMGRPKITGRPTGKGPTTEPRVSSVVRALGYPLIFVRSVQSNMCRKFASRSRTPATRLCNVQNRTLCEASNSTRARVHAHTRVPTPGA